MLRCLRCGNEAQQNGAPVESSKGHTYTASEVFCANGHHPVTMARVAQSSAGEVTVTGSPPVPDGMGRRDVLGAPHSEQ